MVTLPDAPLGRVASRTSLANVVALAIGTASLAGGLGQVAGGDEGDEVVAVDAVAGGGDDRGRLGRALVLAGLGQELHLGVREAVVVLGDRAQVGLGVVVPGRSALVADGDDAVAHADPSSV